jgi:hypothetical protein
VVWRFRQVADSGAVSIQQKPFATSFYESVTLRQAAALCSRDADQARNFVVLDSEIDAFATDLRIVQ